MPTSVFCVTWRSIDMTIALLDINDSNLQLWHGEQVLQSPGYALLEGQQYRFGLEARSAARLRPRDINSRYWWQLSTEALQPALGPARHTADLVHAHLLDIHEQAGQPEELILAAPSSMQREQLALLLGIIEQCPFNVVGLVNRSVALASLYGESGRFYHLEIQLHQAVISELTSHNGMVELQGVFPLPDCGLLQLQERLVEIIGSAFIRQTRFDPRRKADTEQQLYDHLPEVLLALENSGEYDLDMAGYRVRINRNDLRVTAESLLDGVTGAIGTPAPDDCVLLDSAAAMLPGFFGQFQRAQRISNTALSEAVEQHQTRLLQREQALNFITSLPSLDSHAAPPRRDTANGSPAPDKAVADLSPARQVSPTHLLKGGRATPLVANGTRVDAHCELYRLADGWQLRGDSQEPVHVNGVVYSPGQALYCGDSIATAAGTRVLLIEVTG